MSTSDITICYYSANHAPQEFMNKTLEQLRVSADGIPIISVTHQPVDLGTNIVVELERSHFNIYRQALIGAQVATTPWIAMAEDDVLYSPEHFKYRPRKAPFAYNLGYWGIYTWQDPPIYNYKGRRNLDSLICDRKKFIEAMEERFAKYPNDEANKDLWAEPGKYERQLGVTPQETEAFYSQPPNIKFSHQTELSFEGLGTRKRAGELRATEIPYWGKASEIRAYYG